MYNNIWVVMIQTFAVEYNINIETFPEKVMITMFMYTEIL